jgi:hypothetical protein
MYLKRVRLRDQNMITHSKFNNQHTPEDLYDHLISTKNFHFDSEQDIHTSSKDYDESGYGLNLDLLTISL